MTSSVILIDNYRGWDILFHKESETFYAAIDNYSREKRSYSSAKKFIDEYIKDNFNFNPVVVQKEPSIYNDGEKITLIGIRKDEVFIAIDKDGVKTRLSSYDEKEYFIFDERNESVFLDIKYLKEEREKINEKIKKAQERIIKITVADFKKELLKK